MTYRAEQIWEAFKCELTSPPTDDMREALATAIRICAERLYTDLPELGDPSVVIEELAQWHLKTGALCDMIVPSTKELK